MTGDDYERLGEDADRLVVFLGNQAFMRLERAPTFGALDRVGHCAALVVDSSAGTFMCSVYERRPTICRDLERGSPACEGERLLKLERPRRLIHTARPHEAHGAARLR